MSVSYSVDWHVFSQQWLLTALHFLWQAIVVAAVVAVGLRLASPSIARVRYWMSCIGLAALPACVLVTFTLVNRHSESPVMVPIQETAFTVASDTPPMQECELRASACEVSSPLLDASEVGPVPSASTALIAAAVPAEPVPPRAWHEMLWDWSPLMFGLYCVGVVLMLSRVGLAVCASRRVRSAIQPITDTRVLQILTEQSRRLGIRRIPLAFVCPRVSVPMVVGAFKPLILLPPAILSGLDSQQLTAILTHELAHIRRYDLLVNLCQRIVEALLFFHPATWWISRRVRIERENCCDDAAAACTGRLPYAHALLRMAELCLVNEPKRLTALSGLSADGGNMTELGERIRRVIAAEDVSSISISRRASWVAAAMGIVLSATLVVWGQSQQPAEDESIIETATSSFTPEPVWQTRVKATEVGDEMLRVSPVIVADHRVLTSTKNFDLLTGVQNPQPFAVREVFMPGEASPAFVPVMRKLSSGRRFFVEIGYFPAPENTPFVPGQSMRVVRVSDGEPVGSTIELVDGRLDWQAADVDVESGGDFVLLGDQRSVRVYRTETGEIETTLPVEIKRIDAVAISPDREWLVVSDSNNLHFWRWRDQAEVKTIHVGRKIDTLKFTPDGQYLAEGPDARKDIQLRDMRTLEIVASLQDELGSPLIVSAMDISPDGRFLVANNVVSVDPTKFTIPHRVHVWDLLTRKRVFQVATGKPGPSVAFSGDGKRIICACKDHADGNLLAAWDLPKAVLHAQANPPLDAKDRLGDGIQWSMWGDQDGLLSGARLILPPDGLKPGEPLMVEYRLANVSKETKTLECYLNNGMRLASLSRGNRIGGFGLARQQATTMLKLKPGEVFVDTEHLVSIDTTGLLPGDYLTDLRSAFFYPDETDNNTTHEIPHRGSIPFAIVGDSDIKIRELPKSDIHWGKPIAGLQLGAKFADGQKTFTPGSTVNADLFVANVTDQPIECSVALPHPQDGWLFNVENRNGGTIMLERPIPFSSWFPEQHQRLRIAPGEVAAITGDRAKLDADNPSRPRVKFELALAKVAPEGNWLDHTVKGRLVMQGGDYSAIFEVTLLRPEIPALRLSLDTGNVPFSVIGPAYQPVAFQQPETMDDEPEPTPAADDNNWGSESDGLRCRVVPVSPLMDAENIDMAASVKRFASPDEITFAVEIINDSDKAISLKDVRYGNGYAAETKGKLNANHYAPHLFDFIFTDAAGNAIARTQREFVLDSHALIVRGALVTQVKPNESLKCLLKPSSFERRMDYRLAPGDYRVQVRYRGPSQAARDWIKKHDTGQDSDTLWASQATSNPVKFSVSAEGFHEPDLVWGTEMEGLRAALEIRVPRSTGIPTQAPGVLPTTSLLPVLHVKNVSDNPITFVSETGRQGDVLRIKNTKGDDVKVKDVWMSGWPIDVRWTLQPGEIADLDVLTPSLNQGLAPGEYSARYTVRFNSRQKKDKDSNQIFPAPGDYDSAIETGWTPLFLRDSKQPSTTISGRVIDTEGNPIAGAPISCLGYAGDKVNAFKPVYVDTDQQGNFNVSVPSRVFRVGVGSPNATYEGIRGFGVRNGRAVCPWEGVDDQSTEEQIKVVATLPRQYALTFGLVDADSGQPIKNAAVIYKEDESTWFGNGESDYETGASWETFQVIQDGRTAFQAGTLPVMNQAHVRAFATGYAPIYLKLDEKLKRGKTVVKTVRLKTVAAIELAIETADAKPAAGATFETKRPSELREALHRKGASGLKRLLDIEATTNELGIATFPRPAFGDWMGYRIQHSSGHVDFREKDIPPAVGGATVAKHRLKLIAHAKIQGRYLPKVLENEYLEVVRLQPNRQKVDGPAERVELDSKGRFKLSPRLAGWHSFVHRVRHTDADGNRGSNAIASYGPFDLRGGETRTVALGDEGRSVIGRLEMPVGNTQDHRGTKVYVSSGGSFSSPYEPRGLGDEASLVWWDSYWSSDAGREYREFGRRNWTVPVNADGSFHFPLLPPGSYKLRVNGKLTLSKSKLVIPNSDNTSPFDLGTLTMGEKSSVPSQSAHNHVSQSKHNHHTVQPSNWVSARPQEAALTSTGTARILNDHSVQLVGDVDYQEARLQYAFEKPTTVQEIRLEILPIDSPSGPQFGRGGKKLILFDVKPRVDHPPGKSTYLEFSSCTYLQNPNDDSTEDCIDSLTDSGWTVPELPSDAAAHVLVLRLSKPVRLNSDQRLTLTIDSGGSDDLAVLNRVRFAFPHAQADEVAEKATASGETVPELFKETFRLPEHRSVGSVGFLPDSQSSVSLAWETAEDLEGLRVTVRTWNLAAKKLTGEVDLEWQPDWSRYAGNLLLSQDCTRIVGLLDGKIAIWDAVSGTIMQRHDIPKDITTDKHYSVSLSRLTGTPDLSRVAFGRSVSLGGVMPSAHAIVMDLDTGRVIQKVKMEARVNVQSLALTADGKRLATVGSQYGASIWDVESGQLVLDFKNAHPNRKHPDTKVSTIATRLVSGVDFAPNGESFAVCDMLGVKLVDTQTGKVLRVIDAPYRYHSGSPQFVFSADSQLFALLGTHPETGEPRTVTIWSAESGERLRTLPIDAKAAAFSADGKWFAAGKSDVKEALAVWRIR